MPNRSPFKPWEPYLSAISGGIHRAPGPFFVGHPSRWHLERGRCIAFGADAEVKPESGVPIAVCRIGNGGDDYEESFKCRHTGPVYYRFRCTMFICGDPNCNGTTKVMTNFLPPCWTELSGFTYGNPFVLYRHGENTLITQHVFCVFDNGQCTWNGARWGNGPPEGWGHSGAGAIIAAGESQGESQGALG